MSAHTLILSLIVFLCTILSLRGTVVAQWTATRRPGVRFPVGTVYLPSFTSFAKDSKWGCRLKMTSLLKGRKTQTNKHNPYKRFSSVTLYMNTSCVIFIWFLIISSKTLYPPLGTQFRPPIALRTDLSHITTELWEIPVLRMAH